MQIRKHWIRKPRYVWALQNYPQDATSILLTVKLNQCRNAQCRIQQ